MKKEEERRRVIARRLRRFASASTLQPPFTYGLFDCFVYLLMSNRVRHLKGDILRNIDIGQKPKGILGSEGSVK